MILLSLLMTAAGLGLFAMLVSGQPSFMGPAISPTTSRVVSEMTQSRVPFSSSPDDDDGPRPEEKGVPRWLRSSVREARGGPTELRQRDWR